MPVKAQSWRVGMALAMLLLIAPAVCAQSEDWRLVGREADALHRAGKLDEALARAKRAWELAEQGSASDAPELGQAAYRLAWLYRSKGQLAEAEPWYARALAIWEKSLGRDHASTVTAMYQLAEVFDG